MLIERIVKKDLLDAVEKERFSIFMLEIIPHFIGGFITCVLLFYVFEDQGANGTLWFSAMGTTAAAISLMYLVYFFMPERLSSNQWQVLITLITALFAVFLSLSPHILLQQNDTLYTSALLIIIIAMALAPVSVMSYYIEALYIYVSLPFLSIFIRMLYNDMAPTLFVFFILFWITCFIAGWRIFRLNIEAIQYKLEVKQAKLSAEKANIEKSRFLAAASHDIRQPLQAVHLFISAIQNKHNLSHDPLVEQLESSVNSMSELLDSLLDISKLDAGAVHPHPQHILLQSTLYKSIQFHELLASEKGLTLVNECKDEILHADPVLLSRVISNLLNNAVKHTETGTISLITSRTHDGVKITVFDQGSGIPAEKQQDIFLEFVQLHQHQNNQQQGLGLGLSIVKRLCQLQGWPLDFSSDENGSRFSISVPYGDSTKVATLATGHSKPSNFNQRRILVIDDEEAIVKSLQSLLNEWQFDVRACLVTDQAINYAELVDWQPEVILSDFRLGEGKNGVAVIQALRDQCDRHIPAILLTGDTTADKIQQVQSAEIPVLYKPVRAAQLRLALQRLLDHL